MAEKLGEGGEVTRRSVLLAGGALGLGAVLAACSNGSGASNTPTSALPSSVTSTSLDELVSKAKKEGKVVFYDSLPQPDVDQWTKGFTDKYGIPVTAVRSPGAGPLFNRWSQEWNARRYLVDNTFLADPSALEKADKMGMVAQFTPSEAAAFSTLVIPGRGYPIILAAEPMTWNTTKVAPAEKAAILTNGKANLRALADPVWKGRLAILIPNGIPINQAEWMRIVKRYGWGFLEALAKNKPTIYESAVPLNDRLAAGEQAVAVFDSVPYSARAILSGAPLEFAYDNQAAVTAFMMAVANKAPHPYAARLFAEWATSKEGVSSLMKIEQTSGGRNDVPETGLVVATKSWYKPLPRKDLLSSWTSDPSFPSAAQKLTDRWDKIFGYSG